MIKKEFANIAKSKSVMLLLVAIVLIPFVYSFCFLTSAWDPYGNTGQVPVAVVNEDKPTTLEGKKINVGAQIIANLKNNDQLGWHFVSAKQAAEGLKDNKYYTVITIPKNFSKNAATVLSPHPKQMKMTYKTNGSLNYISEVMSQVGADKLNSQIRAKVTNAFASTLFAQVGQIGKQIGTAAKGATQLSDGIVTLDNGVNQYTVGVSQVHDGLQTLKVAVSPLSSGVQQLADGSDQLYDGLGQLNSKVPALTSGVSQLDDGAHQLNSGLGQLHAQIPALTDGVSKLYAGSDQEAAGLDNLNGQAPELASGIVQLLAGSGDLKDGLGQLNDKVPELTSGVDKLYAGLTQLNGKMPALADGTSKLNDGGKQLADGISVLYDSATKDTTNADGTTTPSLVSAIQQLTDGSGTLKNGTGTLKDGVSVLYGQKDTLANGVSDLNTGVKQYTDGTDQVADGIATIYSQHETLEAGVAQLATGMQQLYASVYGATNNADTDTASLVGAVTALNKAMAGLGTTVNDQLIAKVEKLNTTVQKQIETIKTARNAAATPNGMLYGMLDTQAEGEANKLSTHKVLDTAQSVVNKNQQLRDAVSKAIDAISDQDQKNAVSTAFDAYAKHNDNTVDKGLTGLASVLDVAYDSMTNTGTDAAGDPTGLSNALNTLQDGLTTTKYPDPTGQNPDGVTFQEAITQLSSNLALLNKKIGSAADAQYTASNQQPTDQQTLAGAVSSLNDGTKTLESSVGTETDTDYGNSTPTTLADALKLLYTGTQQLKSNSAKLSGGASDLNTAVNVGSNGNVSLITALGQLNDGTTQLDTGAGTLNAGLVQLNGNVPTLVDGITQLKTGSGTLSTGLNQLYAQINNSTKNADGTTTPSLISAVEQLTDGMSELHDKTPELASGVSKLYDGSTQINTGLGKINNKTKDLPDGVAKLTSGIHQIKSGLAQLKGKTPTLASGVTQLYAGSGQLSGGLDQLSSQTPTLASGVKQLHDGSKQLKEGLAELNSKTPALKDGVTKLADGADQLNANSPTLKSGTTKLKDGSGQLADGLTDGYKQVNGVKLTKLTAKMFAEPSKAVQTRLTTVPNYGDALAPYVLALALFIAIIIFNFSYPMRRRDGYKTVADWFKAKFAVGTLVAIAMALIEATLMLVVGLHVDHIGQFYGMTILFALAAMYMTQFLNLAFGGVGIFIALGLLTLSGSGGLFPAETISPLYESTQRFLPMTYAINGYRNAISSGISSSTVAASVAVLVTIAIVSVALMFPAIKYLLGKLGDEAKN